MVRCALAFAAIASAFASPAIAARPQYIEVKLLAASAAPRAGQTILLGFEMLPRPGWHGYWSNPGESGLAPVIKWTAPRGVHFGPLEHPAPTLMNLMGTTSYVHAGPHILLVRMTLDRAMPTGAALPITADVALAACSDKLCVPEHAQLSLRMKVGNGSPSEQAKVLRDASTHIPHSVRSGSFRESAGRVTLRLPLSVRLQPSTTRFFPDKNGYWDPLKAIIGSARPLTLVSPARHRQPTVITGVVSDGSSSYQVRLVGREYD